MKFNVLEVIILKKLSIVLFYLFIAISYLILWVVLRNAITIKELFP